VLLIVIGLKTDTVELKNEVWFLGGLLVAGGGLVLGVLGIRKFRNSSPAISV